MQFNSRFEVKFKFTFKLQLKIYIVLDDNNKKESELFSDWRRRLIVNLDTAEITPEAER